MNVIVDVELDISFDGFVDNIVYTYLGLIWFK